MRKLLIILVVGVIAFTLCGCNNQNRTDETVQHSSAPVAESPLVSVSDITSLTIINTRTNEEVTLDISDLKKVSEVLESTEWQQGLIKVSEFYRFVINGSIDISYSHDPAVFFDVENDKSAILSQEQSKIINLYLP
jgi:hypothetical protein